MLGQCALSVWPIETEFEVLTAQAFSISSHTAMADLILRKERSKAGLNKQLSPVPPVSPVLAAHLLR
jgi:hypothetical protein